MDIRNFFKPQGGGSGDQKKPAAPKPSPNKRKPTAAPSTTTSRSPAKNDTSNTSSQRTPKRAKTETVASSTPTPTRVTASSTPSPAKTPSRTPSKATTKTPPVTPMKPIERDSFSVDDIQVPECLQGLTFVFTGVLDDLAREDAIDYVKTLGGRVTTTVSSKTTYLVLGSILEDGRPVDQGKKYQLAQEKKVILVRGTKQLYGLCYSHHQRSLGKEPVSQPPPKVEAPPVSKPAPAAAVETKPKPNPYAKKANPYTKKAPAANPYAAKQSAAAAPVSSSAAAKPTSSSKTSGNDLWVDRFAPQHTRDILGNQENIQKLRVWLNSWERTFNNPKSYNKAFSNPRGPWKAALLSGPPGIGKTTTATLVVQESGRDLREFNASDARSKKALQQQLGDLTGSQTLGFALASKPKATTSKPSLRCVVMDEVDGMGAGDRSGMAELIQMIKHSKVPIICICNDRQSQKIKSLLPYCMDLRFRRPTKNVLANRAIRIAQEQGLEVERNAAEAIAESCGNDVRQVLNCLQMWAQKADSSLTYKDLKDREKSIQKDEILRVSLFDAAKTIMEGRRGLAGADAKTELDSLFRRSDAFFVDYSFTGLLVQQNYPKILQGQYSIVKRADNPQAEQKFLDRMYEAAESMSDYAMVEQGIRGGDQNWSLLPTCAMMTVKTGYHTGGPNGGSLPGYPEFTVWMGKNSTRGKKKRMLSELHHHMNYSVGTDSQQVRESYLPFLRDRFLTLFRQSDKAEEIIQLMDEYGLSREDVVEKLDEFQVGKSSGPSFADLDSKQKAAFTRLYNQSSHRSQALVHEEYATGTKTKKASGKREKDPLDLDAIDEDGVEEEDSDGEDETAELKKLQDKLKRKGRRGGGKAKTTKKVKR
eukprot:Nitzschia sp. Nitz4//scaffold46_size129759//45122//47831//NITZ4_003495-RA/size129759-augustus-gene-0.6-mRNA-1//1//CDS//3329552577//1015//frame0